MNNIKVWGIHNTNDEQLLLRNSVAAIGWTEMGDLSKINQDINPSIRTEYMLNRDNKKSRINRIKSPTLEKKQYYRNKNNNINHVKDSWSNMISKTSKEGQNKVSNNPNFQSSILISNSNHIRPHKN